MIIIPGWMHSADKWATVSKLLEQQGIENRVLDLPGFGSQPADVKIKTMSDVTEWCRNDIAHIAISTTPITLVGHSCGGRIALQLVADGLQVEKLVLIGSPNLYRPAVSVRVIKVLVSVCRPIKPLVPHAIRVKLRSADYLEVKDTVMQELYTDVIKDDQTHLLSEITTKVELLWGENDKAAPLRIAQEMLTKLPSAQLTVLPKLGHNLHQENPLLLAGKLKNYVTTT